MEQQSLRDSITVLEETINPGNRVLPSDPYKFFGALLLNSVFCLIWGLFIGFGFDSIDKDVQKSLIVIPVVLEIVVTIWSFFKFNDLLDVGYLFSPQIQHFFFYAVICGTVYVSSLAQVNIGSDLKVVGVFTLMGVQTVLMGKVLKMNLGGLTSNIGSILVGIALKKELKDIWIMVLGFLFLIPPVLSDYKKHVRIEKLKDKIYVLKGENKSLRAQVRQWKKLTERRTQ